MHGPAGIGKTFAIATVLRKFAQILQGPIAENTFEESKGEAVQSFPDSLCVIRLTPADLISAAKNESQVIKKAFEDVVSK